RKDHAIAVKRRLRRSGLPQRPLRPFPNIDEGCSFRSIRSLADEAAIVLSGSEGPTKSQQRKGGQRRKGASSLLFSAAQRLLFRSPHPHSSRHHETRCARIG